MYKLSIILFYISLITFIFTFVKFCIVMKHYNDSFNDWQYIRHCYKDLKESEFMALYSEYDSESKDMEIAEAEMQAQRMEDWIWS